MIAGNSLMGKHRRGATIVETAVVLLVAFTFIFAIFEYGRYLMISDMVNNAVREERDAGRRHHQHAEHRRHPKHGDLLFGRPANNELLGKSDIDRRCAGLPGEPGHRHPATPDSLWYDTPFGGSIVVQVNCSYTPMFPTFGFLPKGLTFQSTAMMSSEAN